MYQAFQTMDAGIADRDLRIEIFSLCESASDQNGRLSILGTFETVQAQQFPVILHRAMVVLRIRFWPGEGRQHKVRITVTDPDGRQLISPLDSGAALQPRSDDQSSAYNILVHIQELRFEAPGEHTIDFYLNGNLEGRLPFIVLPPAAEKAPAW
jgi:hypothetical protein